MRHISATGLACSRPSFLGPERTVGVPAIFVAAWLILLLAGCDTRQSDQVDQRSSAGQEQVGRAEDVSRPSASQVELLAEFNRAAALMEQYKYAEAAKGFERVVAAQPDWTAAEFNLGLAYLNMQGVQGAEAHLDNAEAVFQSLLADDPDFAAARFCLGLLYHHQGEMEKSLEQFRAAYQLDPKDPYVVYQYARALADVGRSEDSIEVFEQVLRLDPGFVSAVYGLARQYQRTRQKEKTLELLERFQKLNADELTGGSYTVRNVYGSAGKYYRVLGPDALPISSQQTEQTPCAVFSPDVRQLPGVLAVWDAENTRIETPGAAAGDFDQDGDLDLCLTSVDSAGTCRLWINDGEGHFALGAVLADGVIAPSMGDVDNDGDLDLWLGRAGRDRLLENDGRGHFADAAPPASTLASISRCSRLVDVDSDGDLDLFSFGMEGGASVNSVLNNNRDGTFQQIADILGLAMEDTAIKSVLHDDFDNDRDLDALIFPAGEEKPLAWVNDRVWEFHLLDVGETGLDVAGVTGATSGDPNKDGRADLLLFSGERCDLYLNRGEFHFERDEMFGEQAGRFGGTMGQFADMDNDGDLDIVIADATRPDGSRGPLMLVNQAGERGFREASELDPSNLLAALEVPGPAICIAADFSGNGRCDLLLAATGESPRLIENVTPGGNSIALDLAGTRRQDNMTRSNRSAIGARVEVKSGEVVQQYTVGVSSGPTVTPPLRIHAGLGDQPNVEWLRIFWPDAVLQAELELPGGGVVAVEEIPRKTSSCPLLFAWDGAQFAMVSDFGGVGGLGYFLAPNAYARPDPTEYVPIPKLIAKDGQFVLQVLEPLEETVYFDEAKLVAVDHPQGTRVYPNEMMAVSGPPPAFEIFCCRESIEAVRATDHRGCDVTARLSAIDRQYAGTSDIDHRFLGFAKPHFVELDFGDRLASWKEGERLIFVASGWVEYGYSATNFAAHQAGQVAQAPSFSAYRDGQWVPLLTNVGYPAGIDHVMTLDLTDVVLPSDRKLRITSNLELYWDRIFLTVDRPADVRVHEVAVATADLHPRGYPREYSPDGKSPNRYDYTNLDSAVAFKLMAGDYTRFGEVSELLAATDDCFVIMGRGEEVTLSFPVDAFPAVPAGYERSFLLKTDSYCKDMDLYTAFPDTVEPLPFHGMSGYPYRADERYPDTDKTRQYRRIYNTRRIRNR